MGMPIVVDIRDESVAADTVDEVFEWFRWVDTTFSTFKPESEVSRLARGERAVEEAHPEVRGILERCEQLRRQTGGYFDHRAAGRLDPSALVKGWSVDRAVSLLEEAGLTSFAVNAGGDVRVRGGARPAGTWRVGIQHPLVRDRIAAVVESRDLAVATSGAYERGDHIVDPWSGEPPRGVLSVTVTGPDLAGADAYATAAYAMGHRGASWTANLPGYEAMTILGDGSVLSTPGFHALR